MQRVYKYLNVLCPIGVYEYSNGLVYDFFWRSKKCVSYLLYNIELNPIICRRSFKLAKISEKFEKLPKLDTLLYSICLTKKIETICAKEFMSFVPSAQHYRVSGNQTLSIINFSTECYLCTECWQTKHSVQLTFLPSVSCVLSGTVTNNQFNVVVYRVQICTECMRQKHLVQYSFLPSVLLTEHSTWVGTSLTSRQEAICTECLFIYRLGTKHLYWVFWLFPLMHSVNCYVYGVPNTKHLVQIKALGTLKHSGSAWHSQPIAIQGHNINKASHLRKCICRSG
jgi:hypothetical protein